VAPDTESGHRKKWSGRWDSNPRRSPWQGDALPLSHFRSVCLPVTVPLVPRVGIEPTTRGFSVHQVPHNASNIAAINDFLDDRRSKELSPSTIRFYYQYLTRFNEHVQRSLLELSKSDVQEALHLLPCSPGGKHAYLRALRAFYSWAEDQGLVGENPCRKVSIKVPKPLRNSVNLLDIPKLLAACDSVRDKLVVSLLADTGLRLSELASVRPGDVDQGSQTVRVWGKGAKQRVVRYGPQTAALLDQHLAQPGSQPTLVGLNPRGVAIMLYRLGKATGIRCNAHAFRRTFATESVRNGLNLFYVQSLLGHSTLAMTRIYAEQVNSEDAIKAYKPILT